MAGVSDKIFFDKKTADGTNVIPVEVGWVPDYIYLFIDGTNPVSLEFFRGMDADSGIKKVSGVDGDDDETITWSKITSDGITLLDDDYTDDDGDIAPYYGFIIGADGDVNQQDVDIYIVAKKME
jgi:hypothetical protein